MHTGTAPCIAGTTSPVPLFQACHLVALCDLPEELRNWNMLTEEHLHDLGKFMFASPYSGPISGFPIHADLVQ